MSHLFITSALLLLFTIQSPAQIGLKGYNIGEIFTGESNGDSYYEEWITVGGLKGCLSVNFQPDKSIYRVGFAPERKGIDAMNILCGVDENTAKEFAKNVVDHFALDFDIPESETFELRGLRLNDGYRIYIYLKLFKMTIKDPRYHDTENGDIGIRLDILSNDIKDEYERRMKKNTKSDF